MAETLFDLVLAVTVLWVAWRAATGRDLFRSVVLFIAFGLLMALIWARLGAPDVALAEAAIGAGLTGALLLDATRQVDPQRDRRAAGDRYPLSRWDLVTLPPLGVLVAFVAVGALAWGSAGAGLAPLVHARAPESGVSNPVTAVLLNFRAYDTLLEINVLLLAAVAMLTLRGDRPLPLTGGAAERDPILFWTARLLLPVAILAAAHLLFLGSRAPGGAFQAGALLGGAAVLAFLAGIRDPGASSALALLPLITGTTAFLVVAAAPLLEGREMLYLRHPGAGSMIVAVELAVAAATAWTLALLFAAAREKQA